MLAAPDKMAFAYLGPDGATVETFTYGELDARVDLIASALGSHDLTGRAVVLIFPPGLAFVAALFACFRAGATAVPVPFTAGKRTENRVSGICRDARPAAVMSLSTFTSAHDFQAILASTGIAPLWLDIDMIGPQSGPVSFPKTHPDAIALLQYTSGSTGTPKGVMLSHANLISNNEMIAAAFDHDDSLRGVGWLPLFHDMGLIGHVLQPVFVGGLSVLMSPFTFLQRPRRWLEAVSAWRATTSGGPSHAYALCLRAIRDELPAGVDLSSWKVAYCGAEKVRADVLRDFADRFRPNGFRAPALLPCYGLAEASLLVTANRAGDGLRCLDRNAGEDQASASDRAASCGPPWTMGRVDIVDPSDGERCADGVVGEIQVSGPHVGHGYWNRAEDTATTFSPPAAGSAHRSLRTGDLGFLRDGELYVVGRMKDTIIVFGAKHAAEDVEATIANSHSAFAKLPCAAFGFETGDEEHVVVVQEATFTSSRWEELREARTRAAAAVTAGHGIRLFDMVLVKPGTLPRTTSGKIQRLQAKRIYTEGGFAQLAGLAARETTRVAVQAH